MNERRVWQAAPRTQALVWVFIGVAIAALPLLAVTLWVRSADHLVAAGLLVLTVAAVVYGWRFGLHPRLSVVGNDLVIRNPLRTVTVPLARISEVEPGENGLRITTDDTSHEVWCVQKSTRAIRSGRAERADEISEELRRYLYRPTTVPDEPDMDRDVDESMNESMSEGRHEGDDDSPDLLIHRASGSDARTLAELEQRASSAALGHVFPPARYPYPLDEVEARWHRQLADRSVRARVAELDENPVGYLAYRGDQVLHLGVLPEHQGRGFGRELVDYAVGDILRQHERVTLWVLRDNVRARGFYRAYGFVDTEEERTCEFPPQPIEIKMILTLSR